MASALIIGGSGQIGRAVAARLLQAGLPDLGVEPAAVVGDVEAGRSER